MKGAREGFLKVGVYSAKIYYRCKRFITIRR